MQLTNSPVRVSGKVRSTRAHSAPVTPVRVSAATTKKKTSTDQPLSGLAGAKTK